MTTITQIRKMQLEAMGHLYDLVVEDADPDVIIRAIDVMQNVLNILCNELEDEDYEELVYWQRKALFASDKTLDLHGDEKMDFMIDAMSHMKNAILECEKLMATPV